MFQGFIHFHVGIFFVTHTTDAALWLES